MPFLRIHHPGAGTVSGMRQRADETHWRRYREIEEELHGFFPQARIERFDADTTKDKKNETRILKQFSEGKIDILVGTQMISKGFDFSRLTLTAVLKAEALTSLFDFRADERALQLLLQLMGRAGRRDVPGEIIIQTNQSGLPVYRMLLNPEKRMSKNDGRTPGIRLSPIYENHKTDGKIP